MEKANITDEEGQHKGLLYLNSAEIKVLLDSIISYRDKLLVELLYELGCSLKELVNIRVRDVDIEQKIIYITKGSQTVRSKRQSIISDSTAKMLNTYLNTTKLINKRVAFLFFSTHGGHMTVRRATQIITFILKNNGFKNRVNPQILKYSHVVNAYYKGVPVECIAQQVGLTKQRLIAILLELKEKDITQGYHAFFDEV